jgi:hypothetical protein
MHEREGRHTAEPHRFRRGHPENKGQAGDHADARDRIPEWGDEGGRRNVHRDVLFSPP